ncbi:MAG: HEPN domain-containing protein [Leptospiraceae bacterium]|nr:HEPN domain-containing protein [Leptospiraceae bacterium]MCP5499845.1 HEPN domain-containing protein [Leptospiraceae bacterium]
MENFKNQIIARLTHAKETLSAAILLHEQKNYRSSINRSYYAMFYAVQALQYLTDSEKRKHIGVIEVFDKYFVKTGKFSKEMSKQIHKAFDIRNYTDYHELAKIDEKLSKELLDSSEKFVSNITTYFQREYELFIGN